MAPEIDLKYERLFGFLQDDVTRKRPTVDSGLHLLCPTAEMRILRRTLFNPESPLFVRRLLRLVADPTQAESPLLACYLKPEPQAVGYLTGQPTPDVRLKPFCRIVQPGEVPQDPVLGAASYESLVGLARSARSTGRALRLFFEGHRGGGQAETATALAAEFGNYRSSWPISSVQPNAAPISKHCFRRFSPRRFSTMPSFTWKESRTRLAACWKRWRQSSRLSSPPVRDPLPGVFPSCSDPRRRAQPAGLGALLPRGGRFRQCGDTRPGARSV